MAFLFEERPCSVLLVLAPAEHGDLRPISDFQAIQAFVSGVHDAVSNTGALTVAVKLLAGAEDHSWAARLEPGTVQLLPAVAKLRTVRHLEVVYVPVTSSAGGGIAAAADGREPPADAVPPGLSSESRAATLAVSADVVVAFWRPAAPASAGTAAAGDWAAPLRLVVVPAAGAPQQPGPPGELTAAAVAAVAAGAAGGSVTAVGRAAALLSAGVAAGPEAAAALGTTSAASATKRAWSSPLVVGGKGGDRGSGGGGGSRGRSWWPRAANLRNAVLRGGPPSPSASAHSKPVAGAAAATTAAAATAPDLPHDNTPTPHTAGPVWSPDLPWLHPHTAAALATAVAASSGISGRSGSSCWPVLLRGMLLPLPHGLGQGGDVGGGADTATSGRGLLLLPQLPRAVRPVASAATAEAEAEADLELGAAVERLRLQGTWLGLWLAGRIATPHQAQYHTQQQRTPPLARGLSSLVSGAAPGWARTSTPGGGGGDGPGGAAGARSGGSFSALRRLLPQRRSRLPSESSSASRAPAAGGVACPSGEGLNARLATSSAGAGGPLPAGRSGSQLSTRELHQRWPRSTSGDCSAGGGGGGRTSAPAAAPAWQLPREPLWAHVLGAAANTQGATAPSSASSAAAAAAAAVPVSVPGPSTAPAAQARLWPGSSLFQQHPTLLLGALPELPEMSFRTEPLPRPLHPGRLGAQPGTQAVPDEEQEPERPWSPLAEALLLPGHTPRRRQQSGGGGAPALTPRPRRFVTDSTGAEALATGGRA
ncbi:hypothetical protein CHLRE_17g746847v5 [Chlamydomonas reinhardtii]|uniref:Uncharacterized protein n=1 Tax=Chlamydomonas reinhardtii TaxID=3055 RepID=A0A2K3CS62_CHLRE|nr:uncharacterized protein CHLRE_17g746847v5 [Chlamydomonas reinhardtii]PNW71108.1 hypothetical protein CHLRE_17g746847v5 [Chlamydomonas reinhardtii]